MVRFGRISGWPFTHIISSEHGHSHSHGDSKEHDDHGHGHVHAIDASDASSGSTTPTGDERSGVDHEDPLFGHPVATRAAVVQAAHDLELSRSPISTRSTGGFPSSPTATRKDHSAARSSTISEGHTRVATDASETTPLLKDQAPSDNHDYADINDSGSSSPKRRKPKKKDAHGHAGSMNMQALVLHVLGDALGNVGVIATGLVIWLTSWSWKYYFDPMISLFITVIIFSSALPLGQCLTWVYKNSFTHSCHSEICLVHSPPGCPCRHIPPRG